MVFRMISGVLQDTRPYIDRHERLRRLESLANSQLELLSFIVEGDNKAPTMLSGAGHIATASQIVWHKSGSRPVVSRSSQESLLPRLAAWKTSQSVGARLHFAIEYHMLRAPFTLGLGEPNLSGKPILEYDKICKPLEVYAHRQATPGHPEDHILSTTHQIMEAWLAVAQGLLQSVEGRVKAGDHEGAAKKCWIVERIWKLIISTMDLLQVMDPDDFMRLKHELAISPSSHLGVDNSLDHIGGGAYCLRSTMLRNVSKACKELRHLVPEVVGVEADPKGGPRLQEAIMVLYHSHGMPTQGKPSFGRPSAQHSETIHLLQSFQAIEVAVRQFYFSYQQLVVTVMGSGEYKGTSQTEISATDALSQLYFEPPYFPSLDGAKTFLGNYWHHSSELEEGVIMRQLMEKERASRASMERASNASSRSSSTDRSSSNEYTEEDYHTILKESSISVEKQQYVDAAIAYKERFLHQGAVGG